MVALTKHLLGTTHKYVCPEPLEKMFSKLRQGSGGTYFINMQQILQKVVKCVCGHSCEKYGYLINGDETFICFSQSFQP